VETELFRSGFTTAFPSALDEEAIRDSVRARYALNRIADPEEIAAAISPLKNRTAYCASKAGLQMASKALAIEAAPFNIRVIVWQSGHESSYVTGVALAVDGGRRFH
jgi:hypothetical protein